MASDRKILDGRRVIVADDEPFNLSIIIRMMRELGCQDILSAATGGEALQKITGDSSVDMAVLDFNMPIANGLQILKQIRTGALSVRRETHVLMLTGSSDFGLVGAAMALDVDAFIIKPVSLQAMAGRLEKVFGQRAELKDKADYERIDIEAVSQRLLSRKPVGLARPKTELKKAVTGIPVRLDAVKPGAILSEDVRSPNGELLLGKATMLTERLIRRLVELQTMLKLEYVYVFPPAQAEKSGDKAV
jgi:YesN/AraC family two-component response regulator